MRKLITTLAMVGTFELGMAQVCNDRQKMLRNGQCENCPNYQRAQHGNQICAADRCAPSQVLKIDGTCAECGPNERPDIRQITCLTPAHRMEEESKEAAGARLRRWQQDIPNQRSCGKDQVMIDGMCTNCPFNMRPSKDGAYCEQLEQKDQSRCEPNQIFSEGKCQMCARNFQPDKTRTYCVPAVRYDYYHPKQGDELNTYSGKCKSTQFMGKNGVCIECPGPTMKVDDTGTKCFVDPAYRYSRVVIKYDQTQEECPLYYRPEEDKCIKPDCKSRHNQIYLMDGTCMECPRNMKPHISYQFCEEIRRLECKRNEILIERDTKCAPCPEGMIPGRNRRQCEVDEQRQQYQPPAQVWRGDNDNSKNNNEMQDLINAIKGMQSDEGYGQDSQVKDLIDRLVLDRFEQLMQDRLQQMGGFNQPQPYMGSQYGQYGQPQWRGQNSQNWGSQNQPQWQETSESFDGSQYQQQGYGDWPPAGFHNQFQQGHHYHTHNYKVSKNKLQPPQGPQSKSLDLDQRHLYEQAAQKVKAGAPPPSLEQAAQEVETEGPPPSILQDP